MKYSDGLDEHMTEEGDGASVAERDTVLAVVRDGDESAFAQVVRRHERELRVHCYRMVASFDDAEDLTQKTFLRAWTKRDTFQGRSTFRAWLYRIATNACLDFLDRHPTRRLAAPGPGPASPVTIPWLSPFPDHLLPAAPEEEEPAARAVAKETIELAFLAAIQHLPPRQRAVVILRDVLGWPASHTAELLGDSVASANSALQRARGTLREHLPTRRTEWAATTEPSQAERALLRRYVAASEQADLAALTSLLRSDARFGQRPGASGHTEGETLRYDGRDAIIAAWTPACDGPDAMEFRVFETFVNRQPAAAVYVRAKGESVYQAFGLDVLRTEGDQVTEVLAFTADVFPMLGLPATW
ncbi:RNA polymerase sigma-70 factor, TIGR02960 family [Actinoalloteichus hymeniacidonis]|uniref:RNA polymerase sigma factor n=2 Tax=Actinoalloteichus hymeniacidonis TaxID=340345 RepID=A0AAC9MY67_9PSEU|nr:RNA polymerase sigma-70 factor, TIGR02960 family [Actinoalloteichus hymeniacidonis]